MNDQLRGAMKFLQETIGSITKIDELLQQPGSAPLRDLLSGPLEALFKDRQTANELMAVITGICQEVALEAFTSETDAAQTSPLFAASGASDGAHHTDIENKGGVDNEDRLSGDRIPSSRVGQPSN